MRRAVLLCALVFGTFPLFSQEHPAPAPHAESAETAHGESSGHGDSTTLWKWANFAILLGGIGYLVARKGGPFFLSRSEEIRQGIAQAAAEKKAAEARFAEMEHRLGNLDSSIAELRTGSREEMHAESERFRQETTQRLEKIHTQAEQEIASIVKSARQSLKDYSASLAIELAERRIRERITPQMQDELVAGFAADLPAGGGR
jgi:F0F1-type ATP synthase membrane subunit b/b'